MKRILLFIVLLVSAVEGAAPIRTLEEFRIRVREKTRLYSQVQLSDSILTPICREAVLATSVEVGGVEVTHTFLTSVGTAWYAIPDSVVQVLFGSIHAYGGGVYALKAWYPQFYDVFRLDELVEEGENQTPVAYNYWAGVIEMLPTPVREDTVYLKCYVEHPYLDTGASADSIRLRSGYTLAALELAAALASIEVEQWEQAALFQARYESAAEKLRAVYTRRFDVVAPQQKVEP